MLKAIAFIFVFLTFSTTILTLSRNAWIGLILGLIIICGTKIIKWLLPIISIVVSPIIFSLGIINNQTLINFSRRIVPEFFWIYKFNNIGIENLENFGRIEIWKFAFEYISLSPLWGWGAAAFPILFEIKTGIYKGHTHNLFTELAFSFGLIILAIFIFSITKIIWISFKKDIYESKKPRLYDQAWKASFLVILFSQMFDVQYFDFRISLMFWFLLGGLRNLIK